MDNFVEGLGSFEGWWRRGCVSGSNYFEQGLYIFRNSKIQGFPGLFYFFFQGFSRALEAKNENNIHNELFKTTFLNVKIVNVLTVKQQCALSVSFQYWAVVSTWLLLELKSTKCTIPRK